MTLPVTPDIRTVLKASVANLRDVVVPGVDGEWERFCAVLTVGALEYALGLLDGDRNAARRFELAQALASLGPVVAEVPELRDFLGAPSPYEVATLLLVWRQRNPGALADRIKATLHPVLFAQMDAELAASAPLMHGFGAAMRGRSED